MTVRIGTTSSVLRTDSIIGFYRAYACPDEKVNYKKKKNLFPPISNELTLFYQWSLLIKYVLILLNESLDL